MALTASADTHYVDINSTNPVSPFTDWSTASTNIQDAVDVATNGETVLVTNGTYRLASGIFVGSAITLASVNGADSTVIDGNMAVRCLMLSNANAVAVGFTLTNGSSGEGDGGGVYVTGGTVKKCKIVGCRSGQEGGGVYLEWGGTIQGSLIAGNQLTNVGHEGGGIYIRNGGQAENCTIVGNSAMRSFDRAGGASGGMLVNCIIWSNTASIPAFSNYYGISCSNSCSAPLPPGTDNTASNPLFRDLANGDFNLNFGSPCINSGTALSWHEGETDLNGGYRVTNGIVDMGAFEYQGTPASLTVLGSPGQYGLPSPFGYGTNAYATNSIVTNSVVDTTNGAVRYRCGGWTGSGSVPPVGSTNTCIFTITNNSTITWNWMVDYWLATGVSGSGTVTDVAGWYTNGAAAVISATPTNQFWFFTNWTGSGLTGADTNSILAITMNQARSITANFAQVFFSLAVTSQYGAASPPVGTNWIGGGNSLTVWTAPGTVGLPGGTTQGVCMGWTGNGSVPASGLGTNTGAFLMTNNSAITWNWRTEVKLQTAVSGLGSVQPANAWHITNTVANVMAVPSVRMAFDHWSGDVISGQESNNPVAITMDRTKAVTAWFVAQPATRFVNVASSNPLSPFTSWATAATSIYDAVSVATEGDLVLITNGLYLLSQEIQITNRLYLCAASSSNPVIVDGGNQTRCLSLSHPYAYAEGLTLRNGVSTNGGGAYLAGGWLRNCIIYGNVATNGGGVYVDGTGAVENCTLVGNAALASGGGLLAVNGGTIQNTIIQSNSAPTGTEHGEVGTGMTYTACCTVPAVTGTGNITNSPGFIDFGGGDLHLMTNSPCVDVGTNQTWMAGAMDADGHPRIIRNRVDMGAYETELFWQLVVDGNPAQHGTSSPWNYGTSYVYQASVVTNTVTRIADTSGETGYVCVGWTGNGSVPASGTTNVLTFTLNTNSTLTWTWSTAYFLDLETTGSGTVNVADGWYSNGASVTITAMTNSGAQFAGWYGDVPAGKEGQNPLTVTMDQPKDLTAAFDPVTTVHHVVASNLYAIPPYCTWRTAATNLQDALNVAVSNSEIWVVAGTYVPGTNRDDMFRLKVWVGLYGGFNGTEMVRSQRDWTENITVLSGDVLRNDVGSTSNNEENIRHVVYGTDDAIIDGFVISSANSNSGTNFGGGGMYNQIGSPTVRNCVFVGNYALEGGGMDNASGISPTIENCTFSGNAAGLEGGGIFSFWHSSPVVTDCTFCGNRSSLYGAGLGSQESSGIVQNCTIVGNFRSGVYAFRSGMTLRDCTIARNDGAGWGGGIVMYECTPLAVTNVIIWGNSASVGREVYNAGGPSTLSVTSCDIKDGWNGPGIVNDVNCTTIDGGGNINADPIFLPGTNGTWTQNAVFNRNRFQSTLVDTNGSWPVGQWKGKFVQPDTNTMLQFVIVSNSVNSLTVWGDFSTDSLNGKTYQVYDYHLASGSPCINTGTNQEWMTNAMDPDGLPRLLEGVVDMGAYESVNTNADSDADGLTDGEELYVYHTSPVRADTDGDTLSDFTEIVAGTDPINAASVFQIGQFYQTGTSMELSWSTLTDRIYRLEVTPTLMPQVWAAVPNWSNVPGALGGLCFTNSGPATNEFYRLKVRLAP